MHSLLRRQHPWHWHRRITSLLWQHWHLVHLTMLPKWVWLVLRWQHAMLVRPRRRPRPQSRVLWVWCRRRWHRLLGKGPRHPSLLLGRRRRARAIVWIEAPSLPVHL